MPILWTGEERRQRDEPVPVERRGNGWTTAAFGRAVDRVLEFFGLAPRGAKE